MYRLLTHLLLGIFLAMAAGDRALLAETLAVTANFEGGSAKVIEIDQEARRIDFMPGGDPVHGWPCWWYFRVDGILPGETLRVRLKGSDATVNKPGSPLRNPLSSSWSMAHRASFSIDGKQWLRTDNATKEGVWQVYTIKPNAATVWIAWGPPYTPSDAAAAVKLLSEKGSFARATELCRSREKRAVPMLYVREGEKANDERFGVWIHARQHAWESGSSWVAQGFGEWLVSDNTDAAWLRQHAEIFLIPIMDIDNTATGNGGKDASPHDHNRDWAATPHWSEVQAAQSKISDLLAAGRMDVFVDLHNPGPNDPTFFYVLADDQMKESMLGMRNRFIELSYNRISQAKPAIPMSSKPKATGPSYHPLWRQISANWVTMHGNPHTVGVCLETGWNHPNSTIEGYRGVGVGLGQAIRDFLGEQPERFKK